jgi:hypothetical protein
VTNGLSAAVQPFQRFSSPDAEESVNGSLTEKTPPFTRLKPGENEIDHAVVNAAYTRKMKERGYNGQSLDDFIRMRDRGDY